MVSAENEEKKLAKISDTQMYIINTEGKQIVMTKHIKLIKYSDGV